MDEKIKRLGDAELEIMLVIWDVKESVTSNYILENLHNRRNWKLSTLMTILARLAEKGFVYCDRSTRTNYYSALISEKDYKAKESSSFLEKLYGNSLKNLVTNLYDSNAINDTDLSELRKMIDELGGRKDND
ncbi:BlaI/MecI/CopY family transcriptional regulator [Paenibacillus sp. GCM10027626]|uniref:BlaI/MecI/CopY family transcriptional regulator n=1 Tax=Paenibacillus sp. GCM10027626 TaxID=3273411 RepID=UPI0036407D61